MSNNLGDVSPVRPATRSRGPGWRDPRLWIGVVLVAASVVVGARVLAAADDTVAVWASAEAHGAGDRLGADDLAAVRVRFAEEATAGGYLTVDDDLPADLVLTRAVGPGELLPRAALGTAEETGLVDVPLAVDPEQVPGSVTAGAVVDVYLLARAGSVPDDATGTDGAGPALSGVTVLEVPELADGFGSASGRRQVVVAVPEADAPGFFARLAAVPDAVVTVVRRG